MELLVRRRPTADGVTLGDLFADGARLCYTLERLAVQVPAGRYRVALTVSGRAERGQLWTPDTEFRLPELLDVPGRTAIRIHSLNQPAQTEGCIGVGSTVSGTAWIGGSQRALSALMALLEREHRETWITLQDADTEPPRAV